MLRGALYGLKDIHSAIFILGLSGVTVAVNVVCFGLGFFSLFGVFKYRAYGLLIRAVLGILLSGLSLACFGMGFVRGFEAAIKQHQLVARARTMPGGTNNEPADVNGSTNGSNSSAASVNKTDAKATKISSGNLPAVEEALANCQAEQRGLSAAYEAASLAIKNPPVLSMKDVTKREQLSDRKRLVTKFLDANEQWLGFTTKAEVNFREEMVRLHANSATVEQGIKEYQQSAADRDFALMQLRANDQRVGTATLNLLTILEANWGGWKYNAEKNTLSFADNAVAAQYNGNLSDLNDAKAAQTRLQAELSRQNGSATPPTKPAL